MSVRKAARLLVSLTCLALAACGQSRVRPAAAAPADGETQFMALDEVRPRLAPPLQGLEIRSDGRVELKPFPVVALNSLHPDSRRALLDILSEILVAEVLAVKKTLGNDHEAAVVKGLERIGEAS